MKEAYTRRLERDIFNFSSVSESSKFHCSIVDLRIRLDVALNEGGDDQSETYETRGMKIT